MKLATLKDGSRDGKLVVVSRDLTRFTDASFLVPTLQAALENWVRISPHLAAMAESLENNAVPSARFHEHDAQSPLPRAYQRTGGSNAFTGPREPISVNGTGARVTAGVAAIVTDVEAGADDAREAIALVMLSGNSRVGDAAGTSAFSPVAVTPDELDEAWNGGADMRVQLGVNGKTVGAGEHLAGLDALASLVAAAARNRPLLAGAIVDAGEADGGSGALRIGDAVRIELKDRHGHSIFGAIEQTVKAIEL